MVDDDFKTIEHDFLYIKDHYISYLFVCLSKLNF